MTLKWNIQISALSSAILLAGCGGGAANNQLSTPPDDAPARIQEGYPEALALSRRQHEADLVAAANASPSGARASIIRLAQVWPAGSTVTIAFRGGTPALYARIEQAARTWTAPGVANLTLSFRDANGDFRQWSPGDTDYRADIRIAFANDPVNGGYWSMVGTDSRDATLWGGAPGQASMNLGGFDRVLPNDWQTTTLHEFGHALGFEHEHQSAAGDCDFRFDDDPGYVRTTDRRGVVIADPAGRQPGLYSYLGGPPNRWSRQRVDFNLRQLPTSSAYLTGSFDRTSIMMYTFDAFMFARGAQSSCYVPQPNAILSAQDKTGAASVYGATANALAEPARIEESLTTLARSAPQARMRRSLGNREETLRVTQAR